MFTPPPSPDPRRLHRSQPSAIFPPPSLDLAVDHSLRPPPYPSLSSPHIQDNDDTPPHDQYVHVLLQKKRIARRTRWTVLLVPLVLVCVALSTRYLTHPAAFDALSASSSSSSWEAMQDWTLHKRHAAPDPEPATSAATTVSQAKPTGTALSLSLAPSATDTPTAVDPGDAKVPWSPPVLPTPFPQPFDSTLSTNFTTVACQNFITNMTLSSPFRECRPFSLLVGASSEFITSQRNISALNVILWGTCNTDLSIEQCTANMGWFAQTIQTQCKQDIAARNTLVVNAAAGLEAYPVMREAACQVDPATDSYCYVDAARSTHPSDLYLYQLPLGLALPNSTVPSCTACVQTLMDVYARDGLGAAGTGTATASGTGTGMGTGLKGLKDTYPPAAQIVNGACGGAFVATVNTQAGNGARAGRGMGFAGGVWTWTWTATAGVVVLALFVL